MSKNIVVTGGAKGIGRAVAELFSTSDAQVFVLDRAVTELPDLASVTGIQCDVTDAADLRSAIDTIAVLAGQIDVLINNAGVAIFKPLEEVDFECWRTVMATNLDGVFLKVAF